MTDTASTTKYPDITVSLSKTNGNVYAMVGAVRRALRLYLRKQNIDEEPVIAEFTAEANAGDYDHAIQTCMRWVNVE